MNKEQEKGKKLNRAGKRAVNERTHEEEIKSGLIEQK